MKSPSKIFEEIKDTMKNMNWNTNLFHDPDHNYGIFERIISDAKAKHLAPRIVKFNRYKHKISPWATSGILRSIKYRDKLYKKLKLTPPDTEIYNSLKYNLNSYSCILKKAIRQVKIDYYSRQFDKSKSNIRHTWRVVKEILNKCKNKMDFPNYFTIEGQTVKDKLDVSNHFNMFFANIGPNLAKNINSSGQRSVSTYLKQHVISSFEFKTIDIGMVKKTIKELSSKNSSGHDKISTNFLKRIADIIAEPQAYHQSIPLHRNLPTQAKTSQGCASVQKRWSTYTWQLSPDIDFVSLFKGPGENCFSLDVCLSHWKQTAIFRSIRFQKSSFYRISFHRTCRQNLKTLKIQVIYQSQCF